jgi:hypothetical protein
VQHGTKKLSLGCLERHESRVVTIMPITISIHAGINNTDLQSGYHGSAQRRWRMDEASTAANQILSAP